MNSGVAFEDQVKTNLANLSKDSALAGLSNIWIREALRYNYSHNFSWLGRPIIQIPQDVYALQEIIWEVKPDLIIETGIAHGGSLIMSASMLALLDYCEAIEQGCACRPSESKRRVLGIDIDIRSHNRTAIEGHPLAHLVKMIEGSSVDPKVVGQVLAEAGSHKKIVVCLDSNHTHDHVLAELQAYAPLTSSGSYCIVWDTGVEDLPDGFCSNRPWGKGNNPKTAVWEYLRQLEANVHIAADGLPLKFEIDKMIESKVMITAAPDGFLRRM
ncbi:cephalosporin hydroxylase family protein [Thiovibrio frasassiensis]|uniref:Cephalosporin hydroxylase family protein n=1 Tax=Thiovibrio frasassiensis TaxID=2984131 RepID=A0A9X4RL80_9BACT|nr:cephalosporin hydroxylase family protein [Thiovibrio frasassiensis]MDG4474803.1 cephalosporin hydroxylase family protein [Thiovibrio frasassiensis]